MRSLHTKAHTFASRTTCPALAGSPSTDQCLQKSVLFASPKRNSFFPSLPSVFYFFGTHSRLKNSWTETVKILTESDLTMTEDRRSACNTGLAKAAVQCSVDTFVVNQTLVLRFNPGSTEMVKIAPFAKLETVNSNPPGSFRICNCHPFLNNRVEGSPKKRKCL